MKDYCNGNQRIKYHTVSEVAKLQCEGCALQEPWRQQSQPLVMIRTEQIIIIIIIYM